jgi:hypothetical protein
VTVEPVGKLPPSLLPLPPAPPKKDEKSASASKAPPKKKEKPQPANDRGWFFVDELFVN